MMLRCYCCHRYGGGDVSGWEMGGTSLISLILLHELISSHPILRNDLHRHLVQPYGGYLCVNISLWIYRLKIFSCNRRTVLLLMFVTLSALLM